MKRPIWLLFLAPGLTAFCVSCFADDVSAVFSESPAKLPPVRESLAPYAPERPTEPTPAPLPRGVRAPKGKDSSHGVNEFTYLEQFAAGADQVATNRRPTTNL